MSYHKDFYSIISNVTFAQVSHRLPWDSLSGLNSIGANFPSVLNGTRHTLHHNFFCSSFPSIVYRNTPTRQRGEGQKMMENYNRFECQKREAIQLRNVDGDLMSNNIQFPRSIKLNTVGCVYLMLGEFWGRVECEVVRGIRDRNHLINAILFIFAWWGRQRVLIVE